MAGHSGGGGGLYEGVQRLSRSAHINMQTAIMRVGLANRSVHVSIKCLGTYSVSVVVH